MRLRFLILTLLLLPCVPALAHRGEHAERPVPAPVRTRQFDIDFKAEISPELPWQFIPLQTHLTLKTGQEQLIAYRATNMTDQTLSGMAEYQVEPLAAKPYFREIECFCYYRRTLTAHQSVDLPSMFYIDPEIVNDPALKEVTRITLSYTFKPESGN